MARDISIPSDGTALCEPLTGGPRIERAVAEAHRAARIGTWELDLLTQRAVWSEEGYRRLGYEPGQVAPTQENFLERVHEEDRAGVLERLDRAIRPRGELDHEFRVDWPDGQTRWLHSCGRTVEDEQGRPVHFIGFTLDITERKQAEQALWASELRHRTIVETSNDGIWMLDQRLVTTYVNRRMHEMLGYGPDDMIGRTLFDFTVADDQAPVELILQPRGSVAERHELRLRKHNGEVLWALVSAAPLRDAQGFYLGALAMVMDITERKKANDRRLQDILDAATDGVWDWDIKSDRVHFSARWGESLGYSPEEMPKTAEEWRRLAHPEDLPRVEEALEAHFSGRIPNYECENRLLAKSGEYRPNLGRGKVVEWDGEGRPSRMLGTNTDITLRKRAEEERRRVELQMQHTQKLESLGILAGGIAHDFNNLLSVIVGHTDLALLELPADSSARASISAALSTARRATELTRQMLAYSGRGTFVVEPLDLSALVQNTAQLIRVSISKKCALQCNLKEGLPAIEADASQIRQVVMNLIINASEALGDRDGDIVVTTGNGYFDRTALAGADFDQDLPEGEYVWIEVEDTGVGMSDETRAKVFDPFFTTKFTGRGLGLAAVLGIMRGHRGSIFTRSAPGRGTTFKVLFPATSARALAAGGTPFWDEGWRAQGTALVVDDEEPVQQMARRMLVKMGFDVAVAGDGREGLEVLRSHKGKIDLVVLDLTMPHLDGAQTLSEMRILDGDLKVILCSGYNQETATRNVKVDARTSFLQKPYGYVELRTTVRRMLEESTEPVLAAA